MSDKDFSLDDLVKAHRRGVGLSPARSGLNRSALLARVAGAAAGGVVAGATSAAAATSTLAGGALLKLVLSASLFGLVGGGYYLFNASGSSPLPPPQRASSSQTATVLARQAPAPVAASEPAAVEEPPVAEASRKGASPLKASALKLESAPVRASEPSLSDDVRLMQQVGQALKGGNPAEALELLNPAPGQDSSGMREEKAAARVVTLCQLGRVADARAEAALFQKKYPRSPLATRVQSSCVKPGAGN